MEISKELEFDLLIIPSTIFNSDIQNVWMNAPYRIMYHYKGWFSSKKIFRDIDVLKDKTEIKYCAMEKHYDHISFSRWLTTLWLINYKKTKKYMKSILKISH